MNRYDIKNKVSLKTLEKYYLTNIDFRNVLLKLESTEFDSILENIVYIELLKRGYTVYLGKYHNQEIDFVVVNNNIKMYFQVITTSQNEIDKKKKYQALINIPDSFQKCILSMDESTIDDKGIKKINIIDFLLNKNT